MASFRCGGAPRALSGQRAAAPFRVPRPFPRILARALASEASPAPADASNIPAAPKVIDLAAVLAEARSLASGANACVFVFQDEEDDEPVWEFEAR